jgi:tetratricopeptide (TPR) repeat protein
MNKSVVYNCLEAPFQLCFKHEKELKEFIESYPFFQTAQVLLTVAYKAKEDYRFSKQLNYTSIQAYDRIQLQKRLTTNTLNSVFDIGFGLTNKAKIKTEKDKLEEIEIDYSQELKKNFLSNNNELVDLSVKEQKEDLTFKLERDFSNNSNQHSFSEWLKLIGTKNNLDINSNRERNKNIDKVALIEKFIETEPRISKPTKTSFFSPQEMAKKSIEENDEIVSETLAKIYSEQGDTARAIRIYKKLSLLNPDKNTYFAALIKNLENSDLT